MRIVIDTNVIVDALFKQEKWANRVLDGIREGRFVPIISEHVFQEYQFVFLTTTFVMLHQVVGTLEAVQVPVLPPKVKRAFSKFSNVMSRMVARHGQRVDISMSNPPVPLPKDDSDAIFVLTAYEGDADFIVTRDNHINSLPIFKTRSGNTCSPIAPWKLMSLRRK